MHSILKSMYLNLALYHFTIFMIQYRISYISMTKSVMGMHTSLHLFSYQNFLLIGLNYINYIKDTFNNHFLLLITNFIDIQKLGKMCTHW